MVEEQEPATAKGAQTRRAILDAAIERFGRDGYKATKVADIARDAEVGGTITYAYFPNKEALFLAALDEDAAGVITECADVALAAPPAQQLSATIMGTMVAAVERHPLAKRVLAGLEPHATDRMGEIPALNELRKRVADRLAGEQLTGTVRADIDPTTIANGIVAISLSLLMSVLQFGQDETLPYSDDIMAVAEAALLPPGAP